MTATLVPLNTFRCIKLALKGHAPSDIGGRLRLSEITGHVARSHADQRQLKREARVILAMLNRLQRKTRVEAVEPAAMCLRIAVLNEIGFESHPAVIRQPAYIVDAD